MSKGILLAILPLMVLIAVTTEGAQRAWLELLAFTLLIGGLLWRFRGSDRQ